MVKQLHAVLVSRTGLADERSSNVRDKSVSTNEHASRASRLE